MCACDLKFDLRQNGGIISVINPSPHVRAVRIIFHSIVNVLCEFNNLSSIMMRLTNNTQPWSSGTTVCAGWLEAPLDRSSLQSTNWPSAQRVVEGPESHDYAKVTCLYFFGQSLVHELIHSSVQLFV